MIEIGVVVFNRGKSPTAHVPLNRFEFGKVARFEASTALT